MRSRNLNWKLCAIVGLGLTSAIAAHANADHTTQAPTRSTAGDHTTVGCMIIGNNRYDIAESKDVCNQLVYSFQCAGYQASRRGSSVYVFVGRCAPRVQFSGLKHRVSISRRGSYLVLKPYRISTPRSRQLRYYRPIYRSGYPIYGRRIGYSNVVVFRSSRNRCR